tara:strand:- start:231 stop:611 length:381 start_codon:yes stop_codon:yes gene_type:complete
MIMTKDSKLSLDNALTSTLIPQIENLPLAALGAIESLYDKNIIQYFKKAYNSSDRQSYSESFEKILNYLQVKNQTTYIEEFSKGTLNIENEKIVSEIQDALKENKFEPELIQFKQAIRDLKLSTVI